MNPRRITLTVGTAAGGLLAAAFLPMAVAFADDYTAVPDPGSTEDVTAISGIPPLYQDVEGSQYFDVLDMTRGNAVAGTFVGDENTLTTLFGFSNEEIVVTEHNLAGQEEPTPGSVFDTTNFGFGFENFYSDLVGQGPNGTNLITDTFVTPFGDFNIPVDFDAALNPADFPLVG